MTSGVGFVEGEGGSPAAFFDAIDALDALRHFTQDLAVHGASCVWLPVQNPREKIDFQFLFFVLSRTKKIS